MGNQIPFTLAKAEVDSFVRTSVFSADEIKSLWYHFMTISSQNPKITRKQFQGAMLFKDSVLVDRIFRVFDSDDDDLISFAEYIACLSRLSNKASDEDKLRLSFQMYDFDGDGRISASELTSLLAATLRENGLVISRAHVDEIVTTTMSSPGLAERGFISYAEYVQMTSTEPLTLSHLSLNISSVIAKYNSELTAAAVPSLAAKAVR